MLPLGALSAANPCRTDSVAATITDWGPAAARRPFFEATDSNEDVGGGRASTGHGDGNNCNFVSPAIAWKPRAFSGIQQESKALEVMADIPLSISPPIQDPVV